VFQPLQLLKSGSEIDMAMILYKHLQNIDCPIIPSGGSIPNSRRAVTVRS
jgi:hypothetical protein